MISTEMTTPGMVVPTIHRHGDTYLLFYTGVTYPFEVTPIPEHTTTRQNVEIMHSKQIGLEGKGWEPTTRPRSTVSIQATWAICAWQTARLAGETLI